MCEQISHDAVFFFPTNTSHKDPATQTAVHVIGQHLPADGSDSATLLALSIRCKSCNKWIGNYSNAHEFFLNLIGLVLLQSMTTGQDICLQCFTLTSFSATSPRDRIWNFNVMELHNHLKKLTNLIQPHTGEPYFLPSSLIQYDDFFLADNISSTAYNRGRYERCYTQDSKQLLWFNYDLLFGSRNLCHVLYASKVS